MLLTINLESAMSPQSQALELGWYEVDFLSPRPPQKLGWQEVYCSCKERWQHFNIKTGLIPREEASTADPKQAMQM